MNQQVRYAKFCYGNWVEDTFIVLDALENDLNYLRRLSKEKSIRKNIPIVVEIGSVCQFTELMH